MGARGVAVAGSNESANRNAQSEASRRNLGSRLVGALTVIAGIGVVLATLLSHSFSRAAAGEAVTDLVRFELSADGLRQHRADFELVRSAVVEFYQEAIPAIAGAHGQEPAAFRADLGARYPSLARYTTDARIDADSAFAEKILGNLERHREDFARADRIPLGPLPMTAGPWIALGAGLALVAAGAAVFAWPGRRALVAVLLLGAVMVVGPFATGFAQRASAGKRVLDSLTVTPELVSRTREIFENVRTAVTDLDLRVLPDLAAQLGVTPSEFDRSLTERYPAIAAARAAHPDVLRRYEQRVRIRETGSGLILEAKKYPLDRVVSWSAVPGGLLILASGLVLAVSRRGQRGSASRADPSVVPTEAT